MSRAAVVTVVFVAAVAGSCDVTSPTKRSPKNSFAFSVVPRAAVVNIGGQNAVYAFSYRDSLVRPAVTVSGLPAGVRAEIVPPTLAGLPTRITLIADMTAAPATAIATVSAALDDTVITAALPVVVQTRPATTRVSFAWCGSATKMWYQNEGDTWTSVTSDTATGLVSFDATPLVRFATQYGIGNLGNVYVTTRVVSLTAGELQASDCGRRVGSRTYTGRVVGVLARVTAGASENFLNSPFTLYKIPDTADVIATGGAPTLGIIRRDVSLPSGTALRDIDLSSAEGVRLEARAVTNARTGCTVKLRTSTTEHRVAASSQLLAFPAALTRPTDIYRFICPDLIYFYNALPPDLTFPPADPAPSVVVDTVDSIPLLVRFVSPRSGALADMAALTVWRCESSPPGSPHQICSYTQFFMTAAFAGGGASWVFDPLILPGGNVATQQASGATPLRVGGRPPLFFGGAASPGEMVRWSGSTPGYIDVF